MTYRIGGLAFDGYLYAILILVSIPSLITEKNYSLRKMAIIFVCYIVIVNVLSGIINNEWMIFKYTPFVLIPVFIFILLYKQNINTNIIINPSIIYLIISAMWSWYAYTNNIGYLLEREGVYRIDGLFGEIAPFYARRINNALAISVVIALMQKNDKKVLVLFFIAALALIPTGSRTNLIFFFLFLCSYLIAVKKYKYLFVLGGIAVLIVTSITFLTIRLGFSADEYIREGAWGSFVARKIIWSQFITDRPNILYYIFGTGTGKAKIELINSIQDSFYFGTNALHNSILEYSYNIGAIGLIILYKYINHIIFLIEDVRVRRILIGYFIVFFISCLTDPVLEVHTNLLFIALIMAIPLSCQRRTKIVGA